MTDLEMTKLCAEAMGLSSLVAIPHAESTHMAHSPPQYSYNPLHDDAQAMALVRKCKLTVIYNGPDCFAEWSVGPDGMNSSHFDSDGDDLSRAIVECVAEMQASKAP